MIRLTKEKDPQLYSRLEKENRSGNLERMQREYQKRVEKEIRAKGEEYQRIRKGAADEEKMNQRKSPDLIKRDRQNPYIRGKFDGKEDKSRIIKRERKDVEIEDRYRKSDEEVPNGQERKKGQKSRDYKRPSKNLPPYDYDGEKKEMGVKRCRS